MTTKERILHKALALFAERGYHAVYVGEIAEAVGIKTPSLYKHFKSKQDIFNACVEVFSQRMQQIRTELHLQDASGAPISLQSSTTEEIIRIANALFAFYLTDEVAASFRKLLLLERYHNRELNELYEELFIDGAVRHEERIFAELIDAGVLRQENPHVVALHFYSPVYFLLQKYDQHPERLEEAQQELTAMVQEFCASYTSQEAP